MGWSSERWYNAQILHNRLEWLSCVCVLNLAINCLPGPAGSVGRWAVRRSTARVLYDCCHAPRSVPHCSLLFLTVLWLFPCTQVCSSLFLTVPHSSMIVSMRPGMFLTVPHCSSHTKNKFQSRVSMQFRATWLWNPSIVLQSFACMRLFTIEWCALHFSFFLWFAVPVLAGQRFTLHRVCIASSCLQKLHGMHIELY